MTQASKPGGEVIIFQAEDAQTRLQVRLDGQTAWLSLNQLADLFQRDKSVISKHLKNIFAEGELSPAATVANFAPVQTEGERTVSRNIEFSQSGRDYRRRLPGEIRAWHAVPRLGEG
jgi:hypothetical protein